MIVQVLPSIAPHDAISQHVMRIDDELKRQGIESAIVAHHIHPSFIPRVTSFETFGSFDRTHVLYHMSMASSLAEKIHSSNAQLDMWYHNITPASYFEPWEPYVALELRIARYQFSQLSVRADRGVAASHFSESELKEQGCRHTYVMPVLFDASSKIGNNSERRAAPNEGSRILSVGRFAPHKRIEKLIQAIAMFRELIDDQATLELVGSSSSRWYKESLDQLISSLKLEDMVRFHDNVNDEKLSELYNECDAYLCLSDHEGFCVPLMEAQYAQLPIVALKSAAIPETINGAGIVLEPRCEIVDVVAALDVVLHNDEVRDSLRVQAQQNIQKCNVDKEATRAVRWLVSQDMQ